MTKENLKEFYLDTIKWIIRIITPWKMNSGETEEYRKGWNDCVKRIKKDRDALIKDMTKRADMH